MSTTYTPSTPQTTTQPSPCRCHETAPAPCTCCGLICFDRPNYFCGHLLTDADLSLEQKYVIEKNKLYHRAIDGYGIACGLKLTCDCQCKGHIVVHEGFAIDDCGNDLVVCEDTRFDVIGALKAKGLLLSKESREYEEGCEPSRPKSRCSIRQCFYVTICYDVQQSDYETPFQSGCSAGPKQCLPTRTKERVRFDVTDKLPPQHSYLASLEERFKECFEIYCDGPIGQIMKKYLRQLQQIVGGKAGEMRPFKPIVTQNVLVENPQEIWRDPWKDPCELFCTLRAYFLNQLKNKPDEYNCDLYDNVACLRCPESCDERSSEEERTRYSVGAQEAFSRLLTYMQRYQFDCAMGELIFCCEQPCESHCLVLGTVEVVDGKLTRVCNTPRKYLWAPANLIQVALFTLLTKQRTSNQREGNKEEECAQCCPDYPNFSAQELLEEFALSECGRYHAVTASLRAVESVGNTLQERFDFSDTRNIAAATLQNVSQSGTYAGVHVKVAEEKASKLGLPNIVQSIIGGGLLRYNEQASLYHSAVAGEAPTVIPDFVANISPDLAVGRKIEQRLQQVKKVDAIDELVSALLKRVEALEKQVNAGQESPKVANIVDETGKKSPKKSKE